MESTATISTRGAAVRTVIIIIAVAAVAIAFLGAKWQLGDMLAKLTQPTDEQASLIADAALGLAPADPNASALQAAVAADPKVAVDLAEQTVRLSPRDHRWRIALARALADGGELDRAEIEFKTAIDLAPSYAICRWYYGNFLLRQGRREDAVVQFKVAAADNEEYRPQVFSLLWDYSGHDPAVLESVAGGSVAGIAELARFLANHGLGTDALRNWNRLSDADKSSRSYIARVIAQGLISKHSFAAALEFSRQIGDDPDARSEAVTNGSFEASIDSNDDSHFGWRITRGDPKLDIGTDNQVRHDGNRSLRLTFKGTSRPELFNVAQTVAVTPNARYRLTFWMRTENVRAAAGPLLDVATGDESKSLARTLPFPNGTNDWRQMSLDFAIPADADGIEIRTLRLPCSGDDCPITGIVWYDEFVLTRL